jgi:O-antigen/teichoic acid export membrane protein
MSHNARQIASGSALRVINLVVAAFVSVLIMPFVVRTLGDRQYGIWSLVGTFIGYYGLLDLGLSAAVTRHLGCALGAHDEKDCNRVFNTTFWANTALGLVVLIASAAGVATAPLFCKTAEDTALFSKLILILGLSLAIQFPSRVLIDALDANLFLARSAALNLLGTVLRPILIVWALLSGFGLIGLAWATFLSAIPTIPLAAYFVFRALPFLRLTTKYWCRATLKKLLSFSLYSFIIRISNTLRFQVDLIVVGSFLSLAAVTHYRVAGALGQYFGELMWAIMGVFLPVFSRMHGANDHAGIRRTFFFANKIAFCISSFITFGLIAWGKPFIARWMGPKYLDAYPVLVVMALSYHLNVFQGPMVGLLYAVSKHKFYAYLNLAEGSINLILSLVLVRHFGMIGVALGTLIPMLVTKLWIQPLYVCHVAGIEFLEYLRKSVRTLGLISVSLVIPTILTIKLVRPDYKILILIGFVSAICYALPIWWLVLTEGESRILREGIIPRLVMRKGLSSAN